MKTVYVLDAYDVKTGIAGVRVFERKTKAVRALKTYLARSSGSRYAGVVKKRIETGA